MIGVIIICLIIFFAFFAAFAKLSFFALDGIIVFWVGYTWFNEHASEFIGGG